MALLADTRRYEIGELLSLRSSLPAVICPVNNINKHPDIGCIFRIPKEALQNHEHFTCSSSSLFNITHKFAPRHFGRRHITESSDLSESFLPAFFTHRSTQEHHPPSYIPHRRDNSAQRGQPLRASTNIAAQQSENFQKFYKAVVSPTHVRVTAGGRIVPNNRSLATAPEWRGDRSSADDDCHSGAPATALPVLSSPTAYPHLAPAGLKPPYNLAPSMMMPLALPHMAPQHGFGPHGLDTTPGDRFHDLKVNSESAAGIQKFGDQAAQVKISPPTQFDQTKPFMYNGHLVYPAPPGFQPPTGSFPLPMSMIGNPNYLPHSPQLPTGFVPAPYPLAMGNMQPQFLFAPNQHPMMPVPNDVQSAENVAFPSLPPMPGVVAPSEFLKSQIQVLHNHLKLIEHHMINDRNQIDEHLVALQRSNLISQINNAEALLQMHLEQSSGMVVGADGDAQAGVSQEERMFTGIRAPSYHQTKADGELVKQASSTHKAQINGETNRQDSGSKSRLTIAAALAPPFQPRSLVTTIQPQTEQQPPVAHSVPPIESSLESVPEETQEQIEARLKSKATHDWNQRGFSFGTNKGYPTMTRGHTIHEGSVRGQQNAQVPSLPRSSTFNGQNAPNMAPAPVVSSQSVPYLVGHLPNGASNTTANVNDLVYARPLTEDELRARYLYWGKAPRSIQSGLPKFDGKDFYPPSPVKATAKLATVSSDVAHTIIMNPKTGEPDFEQLFTVRGVPGYKTPSPARKAIDNSTLLPVSQPIFTAHDQGALAFQIASNGLTQDPDFSQLFMEKGVPGYKSPPLSVKKTTIRFCKQVDEIPVTPENPVFEENDDQVGSSQHLNANASTASGDSSDSSVDTHVEIRVSPRVNTQSPQITVDKSFTERVESFRNVETQTQFLQNMLLKNAGHAPMTGIPLSGTISSATAQGYLPMYRGAAAASLDGGKVSGHAGTSIMAANYQSENRPIKQDRYQRNAPQSFEPMSAEDFVRSVAKKEADKKIVAQGWNSATTGVGPVPSGAEW